MRKSILYKTYFCPPKVRNYQKYRSKSQRNEMICDAYAYEITEHTIKEKPGVITRFFFLQSI
jgi:hypothetical protein